MKSLFMYFMLNFLSILLMVLILLVGVAYMTILERKLLGYIQNRKGPNKAGIFGILQPFSDALKLFFKEFVVLSKSNFYFFYYSPMMMMVIMMMLWLVFPFFSGFIFLNYDILFMFCCLSLGSYFVIIAGWSSNSNYSMLGSIRSVAQMISYEVSFFLILFNLVIFVFSLSLLKFIFFQTNWCFFFTHFFLFMIFFVSILAELNRVPFDLIEGESELVSGFNTEYFGMGFALIFLAEYGNIMFMSMITSVVFFGLSVYSFMFFLSFIFWNFFIVWIRGVMPRMRFDELMFMCWKIFLPIVLIFLMFNLIMKFLLFLVF